MSRFIYYITDRVLRMLDVFSVVAWSIFFIFKGASFLREGATTFGVAYFIVPIILLLFFLHLRSGVSVDFKVHCGSLISVNLTALVLATQWG